MGHKCKPIRQCTQWKEINHTIEHELHAQFLGQEGSHLKWAGPKGRITTLADGEAKHGTKASVIRMLIAAGLMSILVCICLPYLT